MVVLSKKNSRKYSTSRNISRKKHQTGGKCPNSPPEPLDIVQVEYTHRPVGKQYPTTQKYFGIVLNLIFTNDDGNVGGIVEGEKDSNQQGDFMSSLDHLQNIRAGTLSAIVKYKREGRIPVAIINPEAYSSEESLRKVGVVKVEDEIAKISRIFAETFEAFSFRDYILGVKWYSPSEIKCAIDSLSGPGAKELFKKAKRDLQSLEPKRRGSGPPLNVGEYYMIDVVGTKTLQDTRHCMWQSPQAPLLPNKKQVQEIAPPTASRPLPYWTHGWHGNAICRVLFELNHYLNRDSLSYYVAWETLNGWFGYGIIPRDKLTWTGLRQRGRPIDINYKVTDPVLYMINIGEMPMSLEGQDLEKLVTKTRFTLLYLDKSVQDLLDHPDLHTDTNQVIRAGPPLVYRIGCAIIIGARLNAPWCEGPMGIIGRHAPPVAAVQARDYLCKELFGKVLKITKEYDSQFLKFPNEISLVNNEEQALIIAEAKKIYPNITEDIIIIDTWKDLRWLPSSYKGPSTCTLPSNSAPKSSAAQNRATSVAANLAAAEAIRATTRAAQAQTEADGVRWAEEFARAEHELAAAQESARAAANALTASRLKKGNPTPVQAPSSSSAKRGNSTTAQPQGTVANNNNLGAPLFSNKEFEAPAGANKKVEKVVLEVLTNLDNNNELGRAPGTGQAPGTESSLNKTMLGKVTKHVGNVMKTTERTAGFIVKYAKNNPLQVLFVGVIIAGVIISIIYIRRKVNDKLVYICRRYSEKEIYDITTKITEFKSKSEKLCITPDSIDKRMKKLYDNMVAHISENQIYQQIIIIPNNNAVLQSGRSNNNNNNNDNSQGGGANSEELEKSSKVGTQIVFVALNALRRGKNIKTVKLLVIEEAIKVGIDEEGAQECAHVIEKIIKYYTTS